MMRWKSRALQAAIIVLLMVALAGRLIWDLLQPLVPSLIVLIGLSVVYAAIFRRRG